MFNIQWDATGERLYETGLDRGVLYTAKESDPYGHGVAFNGLTEMTEKPSGADATDLFADNIKYASLRAAETYGANMGAYTYPEEFNECDGNVAAANGVYFGQQSRKPFGLSYRTLIGDDQHDNADKGYKIHLVYGLTASPSERSYNPINDSPDATSFSWELNSTPVAVSGYEPVSTLTVDSTKVNAEKLTALENILYGSGETEARLPLPSEVLTLIGE